MEFPFALAPEEFRFHKAVGCRRCGGSGYRGRTGIYELMLITEEIRKLILLRPRRGRSDASRRARGW